MEKEKICSDKRDFEYGIKEEENMKIIEIQDIIH